MLTLALAATLVGFVLLILGLITGQVWLAVACIVICLIGLAFLLIDVIGSGRRGNSRSIEDLVPGADDTDAEHAADAVTDRADAPTEHLAAPGGGNGVPDEHTSGLRTTDGHTTATDSGRHSAVSPDTPPEQAREGGLEDYLRSVGGSETPARPQPDTAPYRTPAPPTPENTGGWRSGDQPVPSPQRPFEQGPSEQRPFEQGPGRYGPGGYQARPYPQPGGGPRPGSDPQRGEDPRGGRTPEPGARPTEPERPKPTFDPLDPNWRPPLD